jgi:hypothetical protein
VVPIEVVGEPVLILCLLAACLSSEDVPNAHRAAAEIKLNVHHSQRSGGFFASEVLLLASFGGSSIIFLAISNFDPFYRCSNFVCS